MEIRYCGEMRELMAQDKRDIIIAKQEQQIKRIWKLLEQQNEAMLLIEKRNKELEEIYSRRTR